MSKYVYLDYAAATPIHPKVMERMNSLQKQGFANPSSLHSAGRQQRKILEEARKGVARALGAKPTEIVFTSGSTEASRMAIEGICRHFPAGRILMSAIEHDCAKGVFDELEKRGRLGSVVTVDSSGVVDPQMVNALIDDSTVLVCVQYANHEIGTIQPISKIAAIINQVRDDRRQKAVSLPIYLYVDAAQAGLLSLNVSRLGVDLMSLGANKFYGPAGIGALYARTGVELEPLNRAGGQEMGLRGGTQNVAGAAGMQLALEIVQHSRAAESKRLLALRNWLWKEISDRINHVQLNGDMRSRLPSNLNFCIDGAPGEQLVAYLDKEGFGVATGSACTAANQKPSRILLAVGLDRQQAESSLRITLGSSTTKSDLERFVKVLEKVVIRIRELTAKE